MQSVLLFYSVQNSVSSKHNNSVRTTRLQSVTYLFHKIGKQTCFYVLFIIGIKMVQTIILCFCLYFHFTRSSEIISGTPMQFLIDFTTEKDLKSILIIKEEDKGDILS